MGIKERYGKKVASFGKNVKRIREKKGLTQEDVAYNGGISFTTVNNIENGKVGVTLYTLYALAEGLGVKPGELFE